MDYYVGGVAALLAGNTTPNRPTVVKKALTPTKHQKSPNVTPRSELVADRSAFLSPSVQKKKEIIKKSPKRIFESLDGDDGSDKEVNNSLKTDKAKKHLQDDLNSSSESKSAKKSSKSKNNQVLITPSKSTAKDASDNHNSSQENTPKKKKRKHEISITQPESRQIEEEQLTESSKNKSKKNKGKSNIEETEPRLESALQVIADKSAVNKSNKSQKKKYKAKKQLNTEELAEATEKEKNNIKENAELPAPAEITTKKKNKNKKKNKKIKPKESANEVEAESKENKINIKAITEKDTDSEHDSDKEIDSETENKDIFAELPAPADITTKKKNKNKKKNKKIKPKESANEVEAESKENKININAITEKDTDSEHDSDNEIDSETENKDILNTGEASESSDEEEDQKPEEQAPKAKPEKTKPSKPVTDESEESVVKRTLFVGNVPFSKKCKKEIKKIFGKYGDIETVRIRTIPVKDGRVTPKMAVIKNELHPDRTTVNVYVKFKQEASVDKALVENNTIYNTNHLRVTRSSETGCPDASLSIFVGNVPFSIEDDVLRNVFEKCGEVESIRIVRDKQTNAGKGFGYVNFKSKDAVELALQMLEEDLTIKNRILRVKRCTYSIKQKQNTQSQKREGDRHVSNKHAQNQNRFRQDNRETNRGNKWQDNREANRGNKWQDNREANRGNKWQDNRETNRGNKWQDNRETNRGNKFEGDAKSGAYRRIQKRRNQDSDKDGPPAKKPYHDINQPSKEKKPRKEFVGVTADKKKKRKFDKGQKKKKVLSEILTKH